MKTIPKHFFLRLLLGRYGKITKFRAALYCVVWWIVWLLRLDVPKPRGLQATFWHLKELELGAKVETLKRWEARGKN